MANWHILGTIAIFRNEAGEFRDAAYAEAGLDVADDVNKKIESGEWQPTTNDTLEFAYVVIPDEIRELPRV